MRSLSYRIRRFNREGATGIRGIPVAFLFEKGLVRETEVFLRGTVASLSGNRDFWRGTESVLRETPFTLRERVTDKRRRTVKGYTNSSR